MTKCEEIGLYYGYPKCCIEAFSNFMDFDQRSETVQKANQTVIGCGFVPCETCAKKVLAGEIQLKDLIKDRKCKSEFPIDDMDTRSGRYRN